jgi:hypothetical protein
LAAGPRRGGHTAHWDPRAVTSIPGSAPPFAGGGSSKLRAAAASSGKAIAAAVPSRRRPAQWGEDVDVDVDGCVRRGAGAERPGRGRRAISDCGSCLPLAQGGKRNQRRDFGPETGRENVWTQDRAVAAAAAAAGGGGGDGAAAGSFDRSTLYSEPFAEYYKAQVRRGGGLGMGRGGSRGVHAPRRGTAAPRARGAAAAAPRPPPAARARRGRRAPPVTHQPPTPLPSPTHPEPGRHPRG